MADYGWNERLVWARLQRGWSRAELARQVSRSMAACAEVDPGLSGETVRRWEVGSRRPSPRYRKHLVLVFGVPADELGLLMPEELARRPGGCGSA